MWNIKLDVVLEKSKSKRYSDFSSFLDKEFDYQRDRMVISLGDCTLELPLAYGVSDLLETFITLLESISGGERGEGLYGFPQNDFFDADWNFSWDKEEIVIEFDWRSIRGKSVKDFPKKIITSKKQFLDSWRFVFTVLLIIVNRKDISDPWEYDKLVDLTS